MKTKTGRHTRWKSSLLFAFMVSISLSGSVAFADQAKTLDQIRAFSACAEACVDKQIACKKKLSKQCKGKGDKCFDPCTQEHPRCMAKCPVPSSGK
ncbi:MAG: hypothetical protein OEY00_12640 [Gammaproteobacteria bacterium]|nr:hypothetical protein [Gammaproteobacteria bacterium]